MWRRARACSRLIAAVVVLTVALVTAVREPASAASAPSRSWRHDLQGQLDRMVEEGVPGGIALGACHVHPAPINVAPPRFEWYTQRVHRQLDQTTGLIGYSFRGRFPLEYWILSAWESNKHLLAFGGPAPAGAPWRTQ